MGTSDLYSWLVRSTGSNLDFQLASAVGAVLRLYIRCAVQVDHVRIELIVCWHRKKHTLEFCSLGLFIFFLINLFLIER